ncbi:MAG: stage IV sporulation protein A [Clostridia bacterium]|nr:stage IV sporulation protein A [Clostridia bacterium]
MSEKGIYEAIAKRTGGDIYIGVVGPVRTGKSTFIHKFIDCVVLPNIDNEYDKERTLDEIPQSGSGKTITTTEPKFVPGEAVKLELSGTRLNVRLIDCVGYMVEGASGAEEDGEWRMVMTPWSNEPMPFIKAAETGTEKVAKEHSTIAVLVTTDGSFTDIARESYVAAEERAANALSEAGKPFTIILNTAHPESEEAKALALELENKYKRPVALLDCTRLSESDVGAVLELTLGEFPVRELSFSLPEWTAALPEDHPIKEELCAIINGCACKVTKFADVREIGKADGLKLLSLDAGTGIGEIEIELPREKYFKTLSELSGLELKNDADLFSALVEMAKIKSAYDGIKDALEEARSVGYGIVMPAKDELTLSEPVAVKGAAGNGIKIGAMGESIHMIRTYVKTEVCPTFGTEEQTEEVIRRMKAEFEDKPEALLDTKTFGSSLYELIRDGMNAKLLHMPSDARAKMGQTIEKIINEGASGLICILL